MRDLTPRQRAIFAYIVDYWRDEEISPSIRDIQRYFGTSINGIVCHLDALERKGAIRRVRGKARGIVVLDARLANSETPAAV